MVNFNTSKSPNCNSEEAFNVLQFHLNHIGKWSTNWKIKISAEKSVLVLFTLNKKIHLFSPFKEFLSPPCLKVKYLSIILDKRLTLGPHLKSKRKSLKKYKIPFTTPYTEI